ncbi:MAG TPA: hypothetical protein VEA37_12175 [Flavobacterium sp.]|nr:hypothetical protein [Flavobacterium sp.]
MIRINWRRKKTTVNSIIGPLDIPGPPPIPEFAQMAEILVDAEHYYNGSNTRDVSLVLLETLKSKIDNLKTK